MADKRSDLTRLYGLFQNMEVALDGGISLGELSSIRTFPERGVYFFFDAKEVRRGSGTGPRLVRIGTHALGAGSRSCLRQRLRQHAGTASDGAGNHRGSVFRLLVGRALIARGDCPACSSWGVKGDPTAAAVLTGMNRFELIAREKPVEIAVSEYLRRLTVLWLPVEDEPGPRSRRGFIERNVIAIASGAEEAVDPPSSTWLGHFSGSDDVRRSGLWNRNHVSEEYSSGFLDVMTEEVTRMRRLGISGAT